MSKAKDTIFKDYVKKHQLGEGGYGTVFLVENDKAIPFALKVLFRDVELFDRETAEIAGIRSSRLVQVLDWGETADGKPCVLMEYMPDNLESALDWDSISEDKAIGYFREILHGLEALENYSLLHRDLKPANLFLHDNVVKIGDFGSAKMTSGESSNSNPAMTIQYASPERFETHFGYEVDRWAAAVIFYRMLRGFCPFGADSTNKMEVMKAVMMGTPDLSAVPARFKSFFEKAFQKEVDKRHSCVEEMREHLDACISGDAERLRAEEVERIRREEQERARAELTKQQRVLERERKLREEAERQRKQQEEERRRQQEAARKRREEEERRRKAQEGEEVYDSKLGKSVRIWTAPATGMEFVWVEGGTFMMGQTESEKNWLIKDRGQDHYDKYYKRELPRHEVELDGFWLGRFQVTQAEWLKLMGSNPPDFKGDRNPVERVSWNDCQDYLRKLNAKGNGRYRLPTEAEWEYACRAGTTTPYYFGETISPDQANYDGNYVYGNGRKGVYREKTTPVGSFSPNGYGLYDMHGNVWEWCEDWYDEKGYSNLPRRNPVCKNNASGGRVLRGGSWYSLPRNLRSAFRYWGYPDDRDGDDGVRVVRLPQE